MNTKSMITSKDAYGNQGSKDLNMWKEQIQEIQEEWKKKETMRTKYFTSQVTRHERELPLGLVRVTSGIRFTNQAFQKYKGLKAKDKFTSIVSSTPEKKWGLRARLYVSAYGYISKTTYDGMKVTRTCVN